MLLENLNVNLIVKHLIQTKIGIVISIKVNATNQCKNGIFKDDYTSNCSVCSRECNKECESDEYLRNRICIKNDFNKLMITYNETVNITETVSINSIDKTEHCFIGVIIFGIICLLLLIIIVSNLREMATIDYSY